MLLALLLKRMGLRAMLAESEEQVLEWAEMDAPRESCGIVVDGVAHRLYNISTTPESDFAISPQALAVLINRLGKGCDWSGVWHSHPKGTPIPSAEDIQWHPPGKTLYIVAMGLVLGYEIVDGVAVRVRSDVLAD